MLINGLQKTTLLDFPGKVACTIFLGGCNFRCPFCQNAGLVLAPADEPLIASEELFRFLKKRQGILDGVCITGGEPLLNPDIEALMTDIRSLGYLIKLDTNGYFPERLKRLTAMGLVDYIAMDIKAPLGEYARAVGLRVFDAAPIEESVRHIMSCGVDYEFRTTAAKGLITRDGFIAIGEWLRGAKRYFIQAFRDSDMLICKRLRSVEDGCPPPIALLAEFDGNELHAFADAVRPYFGEVGLRGVD